ncbi:hypothetical protein PC119_g25991 [Phytophthora cactorum]|nr:hypothetical protein PC119_g25991 [Phytophthora cactorum]KAG3140533.1 hypothetical protein C6341_g20002 [Phytophthora cactorum]
MLQGAPSTASEYVELAHPVRLWLATIIGIQEYFDPSGPLSKEKRQAPRVSLCNMFSVVLLLDKPFNIIGTIITKPFAIYAPFPIPNETVVISPFVMNFAGIVFSRKLSSTHGSTRSAFVVRSVAATQDDSFAEQ